MRNEYHGMRWLKCDLQVQTPEDNAHWADVDLRLGEPRRPKVDGVPCEKSIHDKAKTFLRRCHELELNVIGITDHNFSQKTDPRDWFLVHLVEQNKRVARELDREPLTILPGFEVNIGYHVLCLFPPAKKQADIEDCNRNLTKLGLAETDRFENGTPRLLRKDGQNVSLKTLISHVQGEMGGIVIAAHSDQASGMLGQSEYREDFKNPGLYCVEVTKNPPSQRYLEILQGKNISWKREGFYPAYIMSSDAKSLKTHEDGRPKTNSLGYRHTWIKMSKPSIESLRQAFLDPCSRIKLPEDVIRDKHPDQSITHARIKFIRVENVEFLEDQEVHFSPNKNSFIGGRGSGKSTLQEYLRIALNKDKVESIDEKTREKIDRIRNTLNDDSKLTIGWVSDAGVEDEIVWHGHELTVFGLRQENVEVYLKNLPVQFFSQQQLNQLTETETSESGVRQAELLLGLIDAFDKEQIAELKEKETHVKSDLEIAFSQQRQIDALRTKGKELEMEYVELERQWKARSEIQDDATRHQQIKSSESHLERYGQAFNSFEADVQKAVRKFDEENLRFLDDKNPASGFFEALENKHQQEKVRLVSAVEKAVNDYRASMDRFVQGLDEYDELRDAISTADEMFKAACERLELSEEAASQLQDAAIRKNNKKEEVESNKVEVERLVENSLCAVSLMSDLHRVWREQFEQRKAAAKRANELVEQGGNRFLVASVHYQHSEKSFRELWESDGFKPDRRTRLGKGWSDFGCGLHQTFMEQGGMGSPWALLDSMLEAENPREALSVIFDNCEDELIEHLGNKRKEWEQIKTSRVGDIVDLELYRADGTLAGSIAKNSLSDGQRNTAALVLLLAQGGGPLVIDQPEDELDSKEPLNNSQILR